MLRAPHRFIIHARSMIHALPTHPGNAVSDPGAVAVWPPVRRPNIHGVTFDDVRVELRVSGVAAPTRRLGPDAVERVKSSKGIIIINEQAVIYTLSPSRGPPRRRPPPRRLLVRPEVEPRRRTSLDLTPNAHVRARRKARTTTTLSPRDCRCLNTPPTQIISTETRTR
jgi:hypothetical protein